jgi:hypothetical protein
LDAAAAEADLLAGFGGSLKSPPHALHRDRRPAASGTYRTVGNREPYPAVPSMVCIVTDPRQGCATPASSVDLGLVVI